MSGTMAVVHWHLLQHALGVGDHYDVQIVGCDGHANGHLVMLATFSPVVQRILTSLKMCRKEPIIHLPDFHTQTIQHFLTLLSHGTVNIITGDDWVELETLLAVLEVNMGGITGDPLDVDHHQSEHSGITLTLLNPRLRSKRRMPVIEEPISHFNDDVAGYDPLNDGIPRQSEEITVLPEIMMEVEQEELHHDQHRGQSNEQYETKNGQFDDELLDGPFRCRFCGDGFPDNTTMVIHESLTHTPHQNIACPICGKSLRKTNAFDHISSHGSQTSHRCPMCPKEFDNSDILQRHVNSVHLQQQTNPRRNNQVVSPVKVMSLDCKRCGAMFKKKYQMLLHQRTHIKVDDLQCHLCHRTFQMPRSLTMHMQRHTGEMNCSPISYELPNINIAPSESQIYSCSICGEEFRSEQELNGHLPVHNKLKLFQCNLCLNSYFSKEHLDNHMAMQHKQIEQRQNVEISKPFQCNVCSKTFAKIHHLNEHMRRIGHGTPVLNNMNSSSKPTVARTCEQCGKVFSSWSNLRRHQDSRGHTPRNYSCVQCGKTFGYRHMLVQHMLVHQGQEACSCNICGVTFSDVQSLNNHACLQDESVSEMASNSSYIMTESSAQEDLTCTMCGRDFFHLKSMKKHQLLHNTNKLLPCELCGKAYNGVYFLTKHKSTEHTKAHTETITEPVNLETYATQKKRIRNRRKFKCSDCDRGFDIESQLKRHINLHRSGEICICPICGKGFTKAGHLSFHLQQQHGNGRNTAAAVSNTSTSPSILQNLLQGSSEQNNKGPYQCKLCDKSFDKYQTHNSHMRTHTSRDRLLLKKVTPSSSRTITEYVVPRTNATAEIMCNLCGRNMQKQRALNIHMLHHKHKLLRPCDICGKAFKGIVAMARHLNHDHPELEGNTKELFMCTMCNQEFVSVVELNKHILSQHPSSDLNICHLCGQSFNGGTSLSNHMRSHNRKSQVENAPSVEEYQVTAPNYYDSELSNSTPPLQYSCEVCGKLFRGRGCLSNHIKSHRGVEIQKPIPPINSDLNCLECGRLFFSKGDLVAHGIHHQMKTLTACEVCGKAFLKLPALNVHRRKEHLYPTARQNTAKTHKIRFAINLKARKRSSTNKKLSSIWGGRRLFKCVFCSETFNQTMTLSQHAAAQHMSNGMYHCIDCPSTFTTYRLFRMHLHNTHRKGKVYLDSATVVKEEKVDEDVSSQPAVPVEGSPSVEPAEASEVMETNDDCTLIEPNDPVIIEIDDGENDLEESEKVCFSVKDDWQEQMGSLPECRVQIEAMQVNLPQNIHPVEEVFVSEYSSEESEDDGQGNVNMDEGNRNETEMEVTEENGVETSAENEKNAELDLPEATFAEPLIDIAEDEISIHDLVYNHESSDNIPSETVMSQTMPGSPKETMVDESKTDENNQVNEMCVLAAGYDEILSDEDFMDADKPEEEFVGEKTISKQMIQSNKEGEPSGAKSLGQPVSVIMSHETGHIDNNQTNDQQLQED